MTEIWLRKIIRNKNKIKADSAGWLEQNSLEGIKIAEREEYWERKGTWESF